ncbi:ADYC domain-containing protein [Nannocystis sp. SCPEA4]|uniref:ADYC domain-containing protein n=1 Tax=Nannocystis sp. SCPEA4 TaxID=2996787 RepID=UPI00226E046A|nr:ADYC domain-containing protein [Nannocystis sp. SCPEA4]MCY1061134.1 ADYC domain-containing protein [Nannocystis sp. SCPEA4]
MRTSTASLFLLASTLTLAGGCDDGFDTGIVDDGDDVAFRCSGSNCNLGLGNTSRIGDHPLSNLSETKLVSAANDTAGVRIEGGTAKYMGSPVTITEIDVEADGELKLKLGTAGWIGGTQVKGAIFYIYIDPLDGSPTINAQLKIHDAWCEPGEYDPTMTICRYQFLTNVVPHDVDYPMSEKEFGWYHTCPDEDEMGLLDDTYKFSSVLSPNASLFSTGSLGPRVDVTPGTFINGCINGAVSKGQYWLNAFYDASAYRGLQPSQRTAMLRMWMAWHGGQSRTIPGRMISPRDELGGLFDWTSDPDWSIEAGYGASGARCRGSSPTIGMHRQWIDPVISLPGWATLPHCTDSTLHNYAVLGVKVPANLW